MMIRMEQTNAELAARIRRSAFRSGNARSALKLLRLADEVPTMHLPNGARLMVHIGTPPPRPGDTPQLRRLRRKKRWLDASRPLTRHPRLLEALAELLPRGRGRPGADLRKHLHLEEDEILAFRDAIEERFTIHIDHRAVMDWETLNDVTDTIALAIATEAA